jgi:L-lactate dehydrogenase complex protein LldG
MKASGSKEKILTRIRKALDHKVPQPFSNIDNQSSIYTAPTEGAEMTFAKNFTGLGGQFMYCEDTAEMSSAIAELCRVKSWNQIACWDENIIRLLERKGMNNISSSHDKEVMKMADAGITLCEGLVARTGGILLSSSLQCGRSLSILPPVHIVVAFTSQIVADLKDAIQTMKERYPNGLPSMINFATGPSRTADIEKTLVVGVHGPKEVYVFLVDEALEG